MAQEGLYIYGCDSRPAVEHYEAVSPADTTGLLQIPRKPVGSGTGRPSASRGLPLPQLRTTVPRKPVQRRSSGGRRPNSLTARSSAGEYSPIPEESSAELRLDAIEPCEFNSVNATINSTSDRLGSSRSKAGFNSTSASSFRSQSWRPPWLKRGRLLAFAFMLSMSMIGVFLVVVFCDRNGGLATVQQRNPFLWTAAPAAAIVLICLVWCRIEYQGLRYMPWIAAHNTGREIDDELDYVSPFFAPALAQAIKRRHWLAVLTIAVSLCLKVEIVLSTSMLKLATTPQRAPTMVSLLDTFGAPDPDSIADEGLNLDAYYTAVGIRDFGVSYPFGVTDTYAYQKFSSPGSGEKFEDGSVIAATVQGISVDLSCSTESDLELTYYESRNGDDDGEDSRAFNVQVDLPGSNNFIKPYNTTFATSSDRGEGNVVFAAHQLLKYHVDPGSWSLYVGPRLLLLQITFNWPTDDGAIPNDIAGKALMCQHTETIVPLEVSRGAAGTSVSPMISGENNSIVIDMEDLFHYSLPAEYQDFFSPSSNTKGQNAVPGPLDAFVLLDNNGQSRDETKEQTSKQWEESLSKLYQSFGALVINQRAREVGSEDHKTGTLVLAHNRLVVDHGVAYTMASILGFVALAIIVMALFLVPVDPIASVYPDTILGTSIIASERHPKAISEPVLAGPLTNHNSPGASSEGLLGTDTTCVARYSPLSSRPKLRSGDPRRTGKRWRPGILSTSLRVGVVLLMYALGGGLIAILKVSSAKNGYLAGVPADTNHLRYSWTTIPTLLVLFLSVYIAASDRSIRRFAPLSILAERDCGAETLSVNFVDCVGPRATLLAVRHGASNVVLSTTATFLAFLMVILSGSLLSTKVVSIEEPVNISQQTWLAPAAEVLDVIETGSATIFPLYENRAQFGANGSQYPVHTYNDMVFSRFAITSDGAEIGKGGKVTAILPATRLQFNCEEVEGSVAGNDESLSLSDLTWVVEDSGCDGDASGFDIKPFDDDEAPSTGQNIFARAVSFDECAKTWYYFGNFDADDTRKTGSSATSAAWECSYTWKNVQVDIVLAGPNLTIDSSVPPEAIGGSAKVLTPQLPLSQWSPSIFPNMSSPMMENEETSSKTLDAEIRWILSEASGGPIRLDSLISTIEKRSNIRLDLGADVVQKLAENRAIIGAQIASKNNRLAVNEASTDSSFQLNPENLVNTPATLKDTGATRLVVNTAIAYIILMILILLIVIQIWALVATAARRLGSSRGSWAVDMDMTGLALSNPGTLGGAEKLVTTGNLDDWMPRDLRGMSDLEINETLFGRRLRLGWFWDGIRRKRVFAIGVAGTGDGELVFVGDRVVGGARG